MDNSFDIAGGMKDPFTEDEKDFLEIRKNIIRESLADVYDKTASFETIASIHSIDYVNDSQSLTVYNTGSSLLRCYKPVTWIVAQPDQLTDYSEIVEIVEEKVKAIVCLGSNVNRIFQALNNSNTQLVLNAETMEEAVEIASVITKPGEMILFSPCSDNVEADSGKKFNIAVRALKKKLSAVPK